MGATKVCPVCGRELPRGRFARYSGKRKWHSRECRDCVPDAELPSAASIGPSKMRPATRHAVELMRSGVPAIVAAREAGIHVATAYSWAKRLGIDLPMPPRLANHTANEDLLDAVRLMQDGIPLETAARLSGVTKTQLYRHNWTYHPELLKRQFSFSTSEERERAVEMVRSGKTVAAVARELCRDECTIRKWIRRSKEDSHDNDDNQ